jgi:hypothetical protein
MLAAVRRLAGTFTVLVAACLLIGAPGALAAKKWSGPTTISDQNETVAFPHVAINGKGHAVAVWNGQDPNSGEIETLRSATTLPVSPGGPAPSKGGQAREEFGPPTTVGPASQPAGSNPPSPPSVAVDRHGNALAAWLMNDSQGNTRVAVSEAGPGGSFGPPQILSDPGQPAFNPGVAFDRSGNAIVVWNRFEGTSTRVQAVARSADGGFGEVQTLSPAGVPASDPEVGMSDSGGAVVIWVAQEKAPPFVHYVQAARGTEDGGFGSPETISNQNLDADAAHLAVSPNGTAIATWRETRQNLLGQIATALAPGAGAFGPEVVVQPPAGMDAFEPRVGMDRFGRGTLLWIETPQQATPGTNVVHAARTNRKGVFTSGGILESADVDMRGAELAVARAGNAVATWVTEPSTGVSEVHAATRSRRDRQFGPAETLSPPGAFGSGPSVARNRRTAIDIWDTTTGGPATGVFANFYRRH